MPRILVFAKAPEPGQVKTRLVPRLGEAGAARLHARLTELAVRRAVEAARGPVELWCAPGTEHPLFARCARDARVSLHVQPSGTLGDRMAAAARACLASGDAAVLIGTDAPALTVDRLRAACDRLHGRDAVLIPAEDGGYVLLGLRRYASPLFEDIDWGTGSVYAQTVVRLGTLGWSWTALEPCWDVDRPEDIDRLAGMEPELCAGL